MTSKYLISLLFLGFLIKNSFALALLDYDLERIELNSGQKHAMLTVTNSGDNSGIYLVNYLATKMTEDGKIKVVGEKYGYLSDEIIKVSPRKFFLNAGQSRKIRVFAKNPKAFSGPEYRTNLKILLKSNLDEKALKAIKDTEEVKLSDFKNVNTDFAVAIPVFYHKDVPYNKISITNATIKLQEDGKYKISFWLEREGNSSVIGTIKIVKKLGANESELLTKHKKAIYHPNKLRKFTFEIAAEENLESGTMLEIIYFNDEKLMAREELFIGSF